MTWIVETEFGKYGRQSLLVSNLHEIEEGMRAIARERAA